MKRTLVILCAAACLALALGSSRMAASQKKSYYLTVAAGAHDRRQTLVSFPAPAELKTGLYSLTADKGGTLVAQVDASRRATFVLPELKAGATRTYRVMELPEARSVSVTVKGVTPPRNDTLSTQIV